jgi:cytosine/adenosine deaminase-related metal-dependent hydrolase
MKDIFRGCIIRFDSNGTGLEFLSDGVVVVGDGIVEFAGDVAEYDGQEVPKSQNVILSPTINLHDHAFQPPGIPGELIVFDEEKKELVGWLPTTLKEGEYAAKQDKEVARRMIGSRLETFAKNGIGTILEYATSSVETVEAVLEEAEKIGVRVRVGYVAMDQGIDDIQKGLQTTSVEALESTEYLLEKYGPEKICVIDRFPIAVTSPTRKGLAELARKYGALYETHMDESINEKKIHSDIYGTKSIVTTLLEDSVFEPGSRVGLAHAIHANADEMKQIQEKIRAGCTVSIRACPNSNAHLGSHWDGDKYVRFPLQAWLEIGAIITMGTDQGAGRGWNIFDELLDERRRHPVDKKPSNVELLEYATLNGFKSLGIDLHAVNIVEGNKAEFIVVEMAGAEGFYEVGTCNKDFEIVAARTIEGGQLPENIKAMYVRGKKVV